LDSYYWIYNPGISKVQYITLKEKHEELTIPDYDGNSWIKFNAAQSGFFRVKYSSQLSNKLGEAIDSLSISSGDRLGLINDSFALAKAGMLPLTEVFSLIQHFENETDFNVWSDLSTNIGDILYLFSEEQCYQHLKSFILHLYSKISRLGWDTKPGEKDLDIMLRSVVISMLGSNGKVDIIAEAKNRFARFLEDNSSLSLDLAGVVFKLVIRNGGEQEYNQILNIFETTQIPDLKIKALSCLCSSKDPELINRALNYGMSGSVRTQDIIYVFNATSSTPIGRDITWNFVRENWDNIRNVLSGSLLARVITYTATKFSTEERATEIEDFFKSRTVPGIERTIQQALESIRTNASFLTREREPFSQWLNANFS